MKFSCERDELIGPLQTVNAVIERRQTMAVLANVRARCTADTLELTGTDLEMEVQTKIGVSSEEDGEITIPARKLFDICKSLPEGARINCKLNDQRLSISSGRSKFVLSCLAADDFPATDEISDATTIDIQAKELALALARTHFAMGVADVRYYLNGTLWEFHPNRLRCVATDAHRLAMHDSDAITNEGTEEVKQLIVPRKAVLELMRLLDSNDESLISLQFNARTLQLNYGATRFTTKLLEGRYPDYERVIPGQCDHWVTGNTADFRTSLQRAAILSNEKFRGVRLGLDAQTMTIQSHNPEHEEAEEQLSVDYVGEEIKIGFNVSYLLDALGAVEHESFSLGLSGPDASGVVKQPGDDSSIFVVMPMRL